MVGLIHFNGDGKYLCNSKTNAKESKLTNNQEKVTCINCRRKLRLHSSNGVRRKSPISPEQVKMVKRVLNNEYK